MKKLIIDPTLLLTNQAIPHYIITPENNDVPEFSSYLGTPFYSQVELRITDNPRANALGDVRVNQITSLILKTCLVTITPSKNIIKTSIAGRNGTIKEYISDGDYLINLRGMLVSEDPSAPITFPDLEVNAYQQMITYVGSLDIINPLINKFVTKVVFDESPGEIREIEGFRNQLEFSMNLISDDNPLNFDTTTT